jgi:hypothetical protein
MRLVEPSHRKFLSGLFGFYTCSRSYLDALRLYSQQSLTKPDLKRLKIEVSSQKGKNKIDMHTL